VKYDAMLDEYYDFHEWDREGRPLPETLKKIELDGLEEWDFYGYPEKKPKNKK
jgi:aldehyde:ferredoxin oxidoreductase